MLQNVSLVKQEAENRSEEIFKRLRNPDLPAKERAELKAEQEGLIRPLLAKITTEILQDLNINLPALYRGWLVKKFNETYETEIENREFPDRYGWVTEVISGKRVMFDPSKVETERTYKPIPRVMVERVRTVYVCETNRRTIWKIQELIQNFWERAKNELCYTSISKILTEKKLVESQIEKVDRSELKQENFSEEEFQDATYIRKPKF